MIATAPDTSLVAQGVRKGVLLFLSNEFTLQFDASFKRSHREEYLMFVELVKKLRQKKFDDRKDSWTLAVADDSIKCLNLLVGYGVMVTQSAREKLAEHLKKMAATDAVSQAATEEHVDLVIAGPNDALNKAMKNYQKAGVLFMATVERSYNGDEMGLGKSLQALALLEHTNAFPALILCPVKLKQNWLGECRRWLPHRKASMLANDLAEITIMGYSEVHNYVNYRLGSSKGRERKRAAIEGAGEKFFFPDIVRLTAVVADEAHWIKADSRRAQAAVSVAAVCESRIRCAMSGTPIENGKPAEMIMPMTFLGQLDAMGGWMNVVQRYCGAKRTNFGWDVSGASNTREFHDKISRLFYIRRKKTDVLKELPAKIQSIYDAEMSNWPEYRRIEQDITAFMMGQKGRLLTDKERDAQAMIKLGLLRQVCGLGKVEWIIDWVNTFLESGEKFVLYATHQAVQRALVKGLSHWNPAIVLGGCEDVKAEQDKFSLNPSCRLFIGSTLAAGFGITLTVASNVGLAELMWTDSKHQQVFDRCHRIGQTDCVNCYYFLAKGTIDDQIWDVVSNKIVINASTVDGETADFESPEKNVLKKFLVCTETR
jgi:SWI/SNF-related matrix-associated actin-dependent regulator 1 of chromatin subfamily A